MAPKNPGGATPKPSADPAREEGRRMVMGRLLAHGRDYYQFRPNEALSYYLKVQTSRGQRVIWGKDLERAMNHSATQAKTGDIIGVRRIGREAVTIAEQRRDAQGRITEEVDRQAYRIQWQVEKAHFFADRARLARQVRDAQADARTAVQRRPELASTFLGLRGAEELAAKRISNPQDRERFLALVREAIAGSIAKGEPLPAVRLREGSKVSKTNPQRLPVRGRNDEPTR